MKFKIYDLNEAYNYLKDKLANRGRTRSIEVIDKVSKIVNDVRKYGDMAVIGFTKEFDKVELTSIRLAENSLKLLKQLKLILKNFTLYS